MGKVIEVCCCIVFQTGKTIEVCGGVDLGVESSRAVTGAIVIDAIEIHQDCFEDGDIVVAALKSDDVSFLMIVSTKDFG